MKTSEELAMLTPADHIPGPRQGEWTYDAYAALPDDGKRYEIIDGVLYMAPASPMEWHQRAATSPRDAQRDDSKGGMREIS